MPYKKQYVAPTRFLVHNGVVVFHSYRDDDVTRPRQYVFMVTVFEVDDIEENPTDQDMEAKLLDDEWLAKIAKDNECERDDEIYMSFDVSGISCWKEVRSKRDCDSAITETIKQAIDNGWLTNGFVDRKHVPFGG